MLPPVLLLLLFSVSGFREPLTWPAPSPDDPVKTIDVPAAGGSWWGVSTGMDCQVRMPAVPVRAQVKVAGCDDVNIVGGEFKSDADPCSAAAMGDNESPALYLTDFTGTAHIEGILIRGPGFSDGIYMSSTKPNSIGEIEATRIGGCCVCRAGQRQHRRLAEGAPRLLSGLGGARDPPLRQGHVLDGLPGAQRRHQQLGRRAGEQVPGKPDRRQAHERASRRAQPERSPLLRRVEPVRAGAHAARARSLRGRQRRLHAPVAHRCRERRLVGRGALRGARRRRRDGGRRGGHRVQALRPRGGEGAGNIGPRRNSRRRRQAAFARRPEGPAPEGPPPGLRLKVRCAEKCLVTARATISGAAARRLGLRSRGARMPVGFARERLSKAGWARVPVHFSKRQRLRRARRLAVRLHVTVASGGHKYSFTRHLKLVRHRT